jgi:hypothetical protein
MSAALNQAGLIASQTGLSIEDTTGTLAAFASAGLLGSDAGTSFKTMLQAVQAPSGKTKELMDDLGISAYDTAGNFIGITKFAGQLKSSWASSPRSCGRTRWRRSSAPTRPAPRRSCTSRARPAFRRGSTRPMTPGTRPRRRRSRPTTSPGTSSA